MISTSEAHRRRQRRVRAAEQREGDLGSAVDLLIARLSPRDLARLTGLLTRIDPHKFRVVLLAAVKALPPAPEPSEAEWSRMSLGEQLRHEIAKVK